MQQISLILGSDTDWPVAQEAVKMLDDLGLTYQVEVLSPHRTPERLHDYVSGLESRGFKVVIAVSGGAAHLAGVIAALTSIPVIGVPVPSTSLGGVDALYSIVQMPGGVPVASVGIGKSGARNAVVLSLQILALADTDCRERLRSYKERLAAESAEKAERVQKDWAELTSS